MTKNKTLPVGRVAFQSVFYPTAFSEGQREKYSITLLYPKTTDLTALSDAIEEAALDAWGGKKRNWRSPLRDGDDMDNGMYHGHMFVRLTSTTRPGVVDKDVEPLDETSGEFYAGCHARATFRTYTYDVQGNAGVGLGLQNVQKIADDEPLVARARADADFEPVRSEVAS